MSCQMIKSCIVRVLCSWLPFAMLSNCCLTKALLRTWFCRQMWKCMFFTGQLNVQHISTVQHAYRQHVSLSSLSRSMLPAHTDTCYCHILSEMFSFIFWTKAARLQNIEFSWISKLLLNVFLVSQMMDLFLSSYLPPLHSPKRVEIDDPHI